MPIQISPRRAGMEKRGWGDKKMMAYINNGDANPRARARAHDGGAIARDASARDQSDTELIKIGISREESRARAPLQP